MTVGGAVTLRRRRRGHVTVALVVRHVCVILCDKAGA